MLKMNEKIICCILAAIMFLVGMCLDNIEIDSSFSYANLTSSDAAICPVDYIVDEVESCTLDMLNTGILSARATIVNSMSKWRSKASLLHLMVGETLQDLFYYQSTECKEDGQLLLCRSVAVNYIHLKDGEK